MHELLWRWVYGRHDAESDTSSSSELCYLESIVAMMARSAKLDPAIISRH